MDSAGPTCVVNCEQEKHGGSGRARSVVVLVNLMAGEARGHTERQFRAILGAASPDDVRLICIAPQANESIIGRVEAARPDGLIVTGMPPRAERLRDEPLWPTLAGLVDFAAHRGLPSVWSCLAAHAAVLHLDGIERRRLPQKLAGVIECTRAEHAHPIVAGLPATWQVPHSRYNEVNSQDLLAHGYQIMSHAADGGVDIFTRNTPAPFLFCQGHPEYDEQALLREYRRDIGQYLARERPEYPAMPSNFCGPRAIPALEAFRTRAMRDRHAALLGEFPTATCAAELRHGWRDFTVALYANWLKLMVEPNTASVTLGAAEKNSLGRCIDADS